MKKMKTKRAYKKRIRITASGKIKRHCAYKGHNAQHKTTKQKRQLQKARFISKSDFKRGKYLIIK